MGREAKRSKKEGLRTLPSTLLSLQVSSALSSLSIFSGLGRMLSFSSRPGRDLFWRKGGEAHEISDWLLLRARDGERWDNLDGPRVCWRIATSRCWPSE